MNAALQQQNGQRRQAAPQKPPTEDPHLIFSSLAAAEKIVEQDLVVIMTVGTKVLDYLMIVRLIVFVHHPVLLQSLVADITEQKETSRYSHRLHEYLLITRLHICTGGHCG
jgi:hypothetical protein